jgi:2-keto-3-deoxy-L-fuconate dehydrogenase
MTAASSAAPALGDLRAIVTGGASGIGAAVVRRLLAGGAQVAVLDRDVSGSHPDALAIVADVSDDASVRAGVDEAVRTLGGLNTLVNNAGIGAQGTVADNDDDEWHRVFDVNVVGTVRMTRAALPHLRAAGRASVVMTCSVAATTGIPQRALYTATKGALLSLTRAMAADHLAEGIRFNCVNPGTADTPWVARLLDSADDPAAERAALEARQPHGRLVSPDEIAAAIAYLVDPAASSTTGTALAVDGGMADLRLRT